MLFGKKFRQEDRLKLRQGATSAFPSRRHWPDRERETKRNRDINTPLTLRRGAALFIVKVHRLVLHCAGADPSRRDYGRCLCAEEWARFCGCHNSADAIAKYIRSTKYFLKKTFLHLSKVRQFTFLRCLSVCVKTHRHDLLISFYEIFKLVDFWIGDNLDKIVYSTDSKI